MSKLSPAVDASLTSALAEATWFLLVNPVSGNGKGRKRAPRVRRMLEDRGMLSDFAESSHPGHMPELVQEAILAGHRHIAFLGGDGTANEVINGLLAQEQVPSSAVSLGVLGVGTGNDWMKTLEVPGKLEAAVELLRNGRVVHHDAGTVRWGEELEHLRYFINIAGSGFDGEVTRRVAGQTGWMAGSKLSYWRTIVQSLFTYRRTAISIAMQDEARSMEALTLAVGICRYNGGGMMQCPDASYSDGELDVTLIGKMSTLEMVYRLPMMLNGSFVRLPVVHRWRGRKVRVESSPPVWLEVDGEVLGETPGEIECIPGPLRVVVPR